MSNAILASSAAPASSAITSLARNVLGAAAVAPEEVSAAALRGGSWASEDEKVRNKMRAQIRNRTAHLGMGASRQETTHHRRFQRRLSCYVRTGPILCWAGRSRSVVRAIQVPNLSTPDILLRKAGRLPLKDSFMIWLWGGRSDSRRFVYLLR